MIALSYENAIRKFEEIGLRDARQHLDAFHQHGIFGDLESGKVSPEEFCVELSRIVGRELAMDECFYAWHGYVESVPQRNLEMLLRLRQMGYKVCLLSNTNPFMMQWAGTPAFDGGHHSIGYYFDRLYLSYECRMMKPSMEIFQMMLSGQKVTAEETMFIDDSPTNCTAAESLGIHTLCPQNNENWIPSLAAYLHIQESR